MATVIGGCGFDMRDGPAPEIGYWLGARYWGKGYATEAVRALIDHAFTNLEHKALQSCVRVTNPALAPGAGEVRLPVDRRRPVPHPRARLIGAGRPLPARTRHLGRAEELGSGEAGGVIAVG